MLVQTIFFAIGLAGLLYGAAWLVSGSANLARILGVSQLAIGLTVVAIGTSTPELAVSLLAALQGNTDLSIGNIVGSNIANLGLILGATAIVRAVPVTKPTIVKDIPVMITAAVLATFLAFDATIGRSDGVLLLTCCAAYLGFLLRAELKSPAAASEEIEVFDPAEERSAPFIGRDVLRIALGSVALVVGARLLVSSATFYAQMLGVSDLVIGLTVVAIGTSLPELSTSVMAAIRGHSDLALGNVIGSNVMNILLILGVTAVIHPLPADPSMFNLEIPVMVGISILLLPLARRGLSITRWNGVLLVLAYVGFLVFLFARGAI